jgi:outer membrane protein assembly factor BamB
MTRSKRSVLVLGSFFAGTMIVTAGAADWPCYKGDATRSGVTDERLAFPMRTVWVCHPPQAPTPAWPEPGRELHRLDFDYAFQPAIAGDTAYIGSSADDTVRAISLSDGRVRWRFPTGGPIRFAPALDQGKVYVVSDDGHLYCLDADSGNPIWTFRGAPSDRKMLGNGRMISRWPCRSGALVLDDTVYFTAGMWPSEGIYVYALEAETGKEIWCNDRSGNMYLNQPHGGASAFTGVCPQGYMLASDRLLLVPSGRTTAAAYDRETGELVYYQPYLYQQPYSPEGWDNRANGGSWSLIADDIFFSPKHRGAAPDLDATFGESDPRPGDGLAVYSLATGLRELDITGKNQALVSDGILYAVGSGEVVAVDLAGLRKTGKFENNVKWSAPHGRVYSMTLAGDTLLLGGTDKVSAFGIADGDLTWSGETGVQARGLAVANGRLIIAGNDGSLTCFQTGSVSIPSLHAREELSWNVDVNHDQISLAADVVTKSGVSQGFALVLGQSNTSLPLALASQTDLHVISVLNNSDDRDRERQRLLTTGLHGSRVVVDQLESFSSLPYPSYFADLIVVSGKEGDLDGEEIYRVLRPCGGVLCFTPEMKRAAQRLIREARIPRTDVRVSGDWTLVVRGELPNAGEWRYQWADGGKTGIGEQEGVRPPFELLWFGEPGPARMMPRHWQTSCPLSVGGRVFVTGQHHVIAFDAYNGRELWCRELHGAGRPSVFSRSSNFAADDDSVYVAVESSCYRLLQSTGKTLTVYAAPRMEEQKPGPPSPPQPAEVNISWPATWQIVGPFPKESPPLPEETLRNMPTALTVENKTYTATEFCPVNGMIDFSYLYGGYGFEPLKPGEKPGRYPRGDYQQDEDTQQQTAYAFAKIDCPTSGNLTIGAGADWWMQWYLDGRPVFDTLAEGNVVKPYTITNHVFNVNVTEGKHVLAVRVKAGLLGWCVVSAGGAGYALHLKPRERESKQLRWGYLSVTDDLVLGSAAESIADERAGESSTVFALEKKDGSVRWVYRAKRSICNTAIAHGKNRLFLLDTTSRRRWQVSQRLGVEATPERTLVALDLKTGEEKWSTDDVPGGQYTIAYARGVVVVNANAGYDAKNGEKTWAQDVTPERIPVIHGDWVIAQPHAFHLHTGQAKTTTDLLTGEERPWKFPRAYGCGHVAGCRDMLFFRSGTPGFYDFTVDGTTNFGGIRPGCSINMIPAAGLMILPESSAGCSCSYNFQTSLALLPIPEAEEPWYVFQGEMPTRQTQVLRVNFGAPGDRRDADGVPWLGYPRPTMGMACPVPMHMSSKSAECYYEPSLTTEVAGTEKPWLYSSGVQGAVRITADLAPSPMAQERPYTVRIHFAEPTVNPGERVFDVRIQDEVVLSGFDVVEEAGGRLTAVVREFQGIDTNQSLTLELIPRSGKGPIVSALEVVAETEED